ncbi:MAG: histidinol-phosphatase HisJ family protein [Desulfatiglandaceae bacterium]
MVENMLNKTAGFDSLPDYHMHTALCKHAEGDPSEYRKTAQRRGIPEICFADHVPSPDGYDPANRMELNQFPRYMQMIRPLQDNQVPHVLLGIEADYYDGCVEFLGEWLPKQPFDFILGSVHYIEDWGFDNPLELHIWETADVTAVWRRYFELIGRLAGTGLFDTVGHLDLPKKFGHRPRDSAVEEMAKPALDRIAGAHMGIEINTSGLRRPVAEIYPSPLLLSLAREREIPICFGSDSHRPEDVGADFDKALSLARDVGYTEYFKIRARQKSLFPLAESRSPAEDRNA